MNSHVQCSGSHQLIIHSNHQFKNDFSPNNQTVASEEHCDDIVVTEDTDADKIFSCEEVKLSKLFLSEGDSSLFIMPQKEGH